MKISVATPYSHIFADEMVKARMLALSDMAEIRGPEQAVCATRTVLWHCELSLVREWQDRHIAYLSEMVEGFCVAGVDLEVASFHIPSRYEKNEVVHGAFVGHGSPMSAEQMLKNSKINSQTIRDILARSGFNEAALLVENNNHLGTDAYDVVTEPLFIETLLDLIGFGLLLDVAHGRITAINTNQSELGYFEKLPIELARQIHLSRHDIRDNIAVDAHEALADDDWEFFHFLMSNAPNVNYATIEYYKNPDILEGLLTRLKSELQRYNRTE
jgi:hypothetical protein